MSASSLYLRKSMRVVSDGRVLKGAPPNCDAADLGSDVGAQPLVHLNGSVFETNRTRCLQMCIIILCWGDGLFESLKQPEAADNYYCAEQVTEIAI